ncbi:hypothetical protein ES703_90341 [subsurface metagenome]
MDHSKPRSNDGSVIDIRYRGNDCLANGAISLGRKGIQVWRFTPGDVFRAAPV